MSARSTALGALIACRKTNAWSDGVLKEAVRRNRLDSRDAALASRLCYGVVQNRMLLDFYLSQFVKGGLSRLQPVVLDILRLGAYQLTMMERIPVSAAVNEAVEQGKRYANARAAGLINGVLRAMARAERLPEPPDLATRYSHPAPLVELLRENVGDDLLEPLLQADNTAPATQVQVNTLRISEQALRSHWDEQGIACRPHPWLSGCLELTGAGSIAAMDGVRAGHFWGQDAAARRAVRAAALRPGMRVLDCCAAPGGKSFAAAVDLENRGEILSCDIHPHKLELIRRGCERLGITVITAMEQDAGAFRPEWAGQMDAVLADVPCSGLGVIRKKPDIRYKDLGAAERLPELQRQILANVSRYVRPGGLLLYSTCTILHRENEDVVGSFLAANPAFHPEPLVLPEPLRGGDPAQLTLLPCVHQCDGFFLAAMRRSQ